MRDIEELREAIRQFERYQESGWSKSEVPNSACLIRALDALRDNNQLRAENQRLMEFAKAKAEGRLVVLPCKVGDTVYRIAKVRNSRGFHNLCIIGDEVLRFWVGDDGRLWMLAGSYNQRCDTIGHSVFITREAAEKALEVSP